MLRLILMNGDEAGTHYDVPGDPPRLIGRLALGTKVADRRMSRNHAEVFRRGNLWLIRDLGSGNGTFLNDERVEKLARLRTGDRIKCGQTRLTVGFVADEEGGAGEAPEAGAADADAAAETASGGTATGVGFEGKEPTVLDSADRGPEPTATPAVRGDEPDIWGDVIESDGRHRPVEHTKRRKRPAEPTEAGGFDEAAFEDAFGLSEKVEWDTVEAGAEAGADEAADDEGEPKVGLAATLGARADEEPPVAEARRFEPADVTELDRAADGAEAAEPAEAPWDAEGEEPAEEAAVEAEAEPAPAGFVARTERSVLRGSEKKLPPAVILLAGGIAGAALLGAGRSWRRARGCSVGRPRPCRRRRRTRWNSHWRTIRGQRPSHRPPRRCRSSSPRRPPSASGGRRRRRRPCGPPTPSRPRLRSPRRSPAPTRPRPSATAPCWCPGRARRSPNPRPGSPAPKTSGR